MLMKTNSFMRKGHYIGVNSNCILLARFYIYKVGYRLVVHARGILITVHKSFIDFSK